MAEIESIERKRGNGDEYSFQSLRQEGISLLQELSGEIWTDYNLHDPGFTILEQLCYALTDLIYRTEFDTADYLTGEDGNIGFEKQALYPPHDIFPGQPITINDYRKIIFDAIPEIDNVWVRPVKDGKLQGLYRVYVNLIEEVEDQEAVREAIKRIYAASRNLCEDLEEVSIASHIDYTLHGKVEIDGRRPATEMLAEIYFECSKQICPGIKPYSFEEMLSKGKSLEEIYTGPLTEHGYIEESELDQERDSVTISDMIGVIRDIEGVRYIDSLCLKDIEGKQTDHIDYDKSLQSVPCLLFPTSNDEVGVRLHKSEREYRVALGNVTAEFDRLNSKYQALRRTRQDFARVDALPKGEFRNLGEYYSIQNHFPVIYGINQYGVPDSEPPRRRAQARQLKAYLLFFEQVMANFLADVQGVSRLFSLDEQLKESSFHQLLTNVPHVEELYQEKLAEVDSEIGQILSRYDKFGDRRNRILDYLLGIYGEKFSQNSLRHFNYYHTAQELERELVHNKIHFLKHIVEISQKRAGAFNYREASWNSDNISGLQKKVSILLDLKYSETRSLTDVFVEKGLELISDDEFSRLQEGTVELEFVDLGDIEERVKQPFREVPPEEPAGRDDRRLFDEIVFLKHNVVSESILRNGIYLDRYRVGSAGEGNSFQVIFRPGEDDRWLYLASYGTEKEAISAANDLRRFLLKLNVESEGIHIIEHVLLRPLSREKHDIEVPDDFYPFRISVIFPAWSARFNDKEFRKLAEETVRLNCPAHIHPEFCWLDFRRMHEFEVLYRKWLDLESGNGAKGAELDEVSELLIAFLLENRTER